MDKSALSYGYANKVCFCKGGHPIANTVLPDALNSYI